MHRLRRFEDWLLRVEGSLCVALVLAMLGLAAYNVFYRNVLVAVQRYWAHSGPTVTEHEPQTSSSPVTAPARGENGGFGGGFGQADPSGVERSAPPAGNDLDAAGGFGGGFGEPEPEPEPEGAGGFGGGSGAAKPESDAEGDGGFGGGFGAAAGEGGADPGGSGGADPFADLPDINAAPALAEDPELGGPPEPGSWAARGIDFIDAIKLDWIDVFLRHLVIIVSFLGAAIATRQGKHINVDALSKLLGSRGRKLAAIITNLLALGVCLVLAQAGDRLVQISREHPKAIVGVIEDWQFQLMFPVGFGLLAVHFCIRLFEVATWRPPGPQSASGVGQTDATESAAEDPAHAPSVADGGDR